MNNEKVNTICIYLTKEDKNRLTNIKYKYKLSYSTIADSIAECLIAHSDVKQYEETHIYDNEPKRENQTSIKPRFHGNQVLITKPLIFYTNILKLFLRHELVKRGYLTQKTFEKVQKEIYHEFETRKEPNWDGNEWNRKLPKFLKKNKTYYKKILEDM